MQIQQEVRGLNLIYSFQFLWLSIRIKRKKTLYFNYFCLRQSCEVWLNSSSCCCFLLFRWKKKYMECYYGRLALSLHLDHGICKSLHTSRTNALFRLSALINEAAFSVTSINDVIKACLVEYFNVSANVLFKKHCKWFSIESSKWMLAFRNCKIKNYCTNNLPFWKDCSLVYQNVYPSRGVPMLLGKGILLFQFLFCQSFFCLIRLFVYFFFFFWLFFFLSVLFCFVFGCFIIVLVVALFFGGFFVFFFCLFCCFVFVCVCVCFLGGRLLISLLFLSFCFAFLLLFSVQ